MNKFLEIFFYALILKLIRSDIITEKIYTNANAYQITATFAPYLIRARFDIDMSLDYNLFSDFFAHDLYSPTKKDVLYKERLLTGSIFKGEFSFTSSSDILKDFELCSLPYKDYTITGSLGLGPDIDPDNSVIYHFYNKGFIPKKAFGFGKIKDNVVMFFGGVPKKYKENLFETNIKIITNNKGWGFKLNSIIFNNKEQTTFDNTYYAYIDVNNDRIFAPEEFMDFVEKNIFKEYIKKNICQLKGGDEISFYNCKCSKITDFPDMEIIFEGKYKIVWNFKKSFMQLNKSEECLFLIQRNYIDPKSDKWLFGSLFIEDFVSEFDYENKTMTFYTKTPIIKNFSHSFKGLQKTLFIVNFLVLTLGHLLLLRGFFSK